MLLINLSDVTCCLSIATKFLGEGRFDELLVGRRLFSEAESTKRNEANTSMTASMAKSVHNGAPIFCHLAKLAKNKIVVITELMMRDEKKVRCLKRCVAQLR